MTREEKSNLLNELLEIEEKNDIGNLTRTERGEFQQWVKGLEQEPVLDRVREQIKSHLRGVEITLEVLVENDPLRPKMEGAKDTLEECLNLIDKAESEG